MGNEFTASLLSSGRMTNAQISLWSGVAASLAALDAISREGATTVVKIDGGRPDGSFYSVVVSGEKLGEEFFRKDSGDLPALLQEAIEFYVTRVRSRAG